jgi:hypothetical protein
MGIFNNNQLLKRIHDSILSKSTGTPKQFANKLSISESKLYRILSELKDHGAIITFDPSRPSYGYENEDEIILLLKQYFTNK